MQLTLRTDQGPFLISLNPETNESWKTAESQTVRNFLLAISFLGFCLFGWLYYEATKALPSLPTAAERLHIALKPLFELLAAVTLFLCWVALSKSKRNSSASANSDQPGQETDERRPTPWGVRLLMLFIAGLLVSLFLGQDLWIFLLPSLKSVWQMLVVLAMYLSPFLAKPRPAIQLPHFRQHRSETGMRLNTLLLLALVFVAGMGSISGVHYIALNFFHSYAQAITLIFSIRIPPERCRDLGTMLSESPCWISD